MNLKTLFLTENECYKSGQRITVKGIMVHSTGANNPDLKRYVGPDDGLLGVNQYGNHWNTYRPGGRQVCVHGFIGKLKDGSIATYQTLPWNMRGWHCAGDANNTHIGFEICEDGLNDANYLKKVYKEAVELCAYLCKQFNLDPKKDGVIICHAEGYRRGIASNHGDVLHWWPKHGLNMDTFRAEVAAAMGTPAGGSTGSSGSGVLYRVQCGAFSQRANADTLNSKLKAAGYETDMVTVDGLYKVQVGAFSQRAIAEKLAAELKAKGFSTYITTGKGTPAGSGSSTAPTIKKGDKVKVKSGAKTYTGGSLASFVYSTTYDILEVNGDRAVIGIGTAVTAAVKLADLTLA